MNKHITLIIFLVLRTLTAEAQNLILPNDACEADTAQNDLIGLSINATGFFHDNEYDRALVDCYTYSLPGVRLTAYATYNPIRQIHLEAGLHATYFHGANKYPCYAFHDIAKWKGDQYQSGAHILPWFRAVANVGHSQFVVGDIYRGDAHGLSEVLYNPELSLSCDPEMGLQYRLSYRHYELEAWLNWQSFIFDTSTHQEAFTVGIANRFKWQAHSGALRWEVPVNLLAIHRGGEMDVSKGGTQTLWNGSAGIRADYALGTNWIRSICGEANALLCWQQAGGLWPFKTGMAFNIAAKCDFTPGVALRLGYFLAPQKFISIYGAPFYSTQSLADKSLDIKTLSTLTASVRYSKIFARFYELGVYANAYYYTSKPMSNFNFAFGAFIHVTPHFRLKKSK